MNVAHSTEDSSSLVMLTSLSKKHDSIIMFIFI